MDRENVCLLMSASAITSVFQRALLCSGIHHISQTCVKKEVNVLSAFRHPSIIRVLGLPSRVDDPDLMQVCLVSELAPERGLDDYLRQDDKAELLSWDDRIRLLVDAAAAVHCLHTHIPPVHHRDIKSGNFALTLDLQPKLIDCGLARYLPQEGDPLRSVMPTKSSQRPGTPAYGCPRYMSRGEYEGKSEVFSFGIVMAEVLTGRLQGGDVFHQEEDELVPDKRAGAWHVACVAELSELTVACMADYKKRVASMGEVLQRLQHMVTYCPSVVAAKAARNRAQLTELHQKRLQILYEAQQMRVAELARPECSNCGDKYDAAAGVVCLAGHAQCADCFNRSLMDQTQMAAFQAFAAAEGQLVCQFCQPSTRFSAEMQQRGFSLADQASQNSLLRARVEFVDAQLSRLPQTH
jgi:hypothetical protein